MNHILSTQQDGVFLIRFNRPEKRNAFTQDMYRKLEQLLINAEQDDSIQAILLCGHQGAFSAGNDLEDFIKMDPDLPVPVMSFLRTLVAVEKPLVAAVEGVAVGIGTTLLLHCDLVYAAKSSRFRLPFVNLGLVPEAASSLLLPRLAGHQRAAELLLLGEFFDSAKARDYGIVNEVLADSQLMDYALEKAQKLASQPRQALLLSKKLLTRDYQDEIEDRLGEEGMLFTQQLATEEARKALSQALTIKK